MHTKRPLLPYLLFGLKILPTNTNSNWKPVIAIISIHYQNWKKKDSLPVEIIVDWSKASLKNSKLA